MILGAFVGGQLRAADLAALSAAAELGARGGAMEGVFGQVPGLSERTRSKAISYLSAFFKNIASDDSVRSQILKKCIS